MIIGSHAYASNMMVHKEKLVNDGHEVLMPAFDNLPGLDDLGVCKYNRDQIEQADEVHMFWDQRSLGTIFDMGMVFALRKKMKIIYLEPKTLRGVFEKYSKESLEE
jgi:hypothetical protein